MSQDTSFSRHQSYNNRFRTSSSGGGGDSATPDTVVSLPHPASSSSDVDVFGHSANFGKLTSGQDSGHQDVKNCSAQRASASEEQPRRCSEIVLGAGIHSAVTPTGSGSQTNAQEHGGQGSSSQVPAPGAPGKPRRVSRQMSASTKRHNFAAVRSVSGGNSTSLDSNRDDVFLEMDVDAATHRTQQQQQGLYDSCLFPGKRGHVLSTSSTASATPNPYNLLNHRLHDAVWFCNCLFFVFFCCLPAVHYMEQSDVYFKMDDQKKASRLGRVSSVLFFVGALLTLLFFSLLFFLVIYFTTH